MRRFGPLVFLVCVVLTVSSQERIPLTIAETHEAATLVQTAAFPAKCGIDDSVYVRFFNGDLMPPSRISPDGNKVLTFGLEATRYYGHARIWDFAPTRDGGVYELIFYRLKDSGEGYRVLTFNRDGKLERDVSVDVPFDPQHIAVLGDGNMILEGRKTTKLGGHTGEPAMALVSDRGILIKVLELDGDLKVMASDTSPQAAQAAQEQFNRGINLSNAQSADDGNVYVVRKSTTGPLFAISPDGTTRTVKLPKFGDGVINVAMVTRGELLLHYVAVEKLEGGYRNSDLGFYAVYDLGTMKKIREYSLELTSPLANSIPACYSLNQFTFLRINENYHPVLYIAKVR